MNDLIKEHPAWIVIAATLIGSGVGSGGTTLMTKVDASTLKATTDNHTIQLQKLWDKKADLDDVNYLKELMYTKLENMRCSP